MRALLIAAMVVSLWPAAVIATIVATGGTSQQESDSAGGSSPPERALEETAEASESHLPKNETQEATAILHRYKEREHKEEERIRAEHKLAPIIGDARDLTEEFSEYEIVEGEPVPEYPERAYVLAGKVSLWLSEQGLKATGGERGFAEAIEAQLRALGSLAESPAQGRLNAYDDAVEAVNRAAAAAVE